MSDDDYGRVPAGWYPDPLGLPQLRWWDNHAWTEHVSDARQPMMPAQTATPTMFADDELPSRRSRRGADSATTDEPPIQQPTAAVLRQLAPPSAIDAPPLVEPPVSAPPASVPSAAVPAASIPSAAVPVASVPFAAVPAASVPAAAAPAASVPAAPVPSAVPPPASSPFTAVPPTSAADASAADAFAAAAFADVQARSAASAAPDAGLPSASWNLLHSAGADPVSAAQGSAPAPAAYASAPQDYSSAPGYGSGYSSAPGAPAFVPTWTESPVSASGPGRRGTHQVVGTTAPHVQSVEVWAIALLPMLQLLLSLLVLAAFSTGPSVVLMAAIWLGPYPVTLVLSLLDYRSLWRRGVDRPATWLWALGTAPVYLTARALKLSRNTGAGYGPLAVFLMLSGLVGASILAVPGLIIAALPVVFAAEASNSIELAARSIGGAMQVDCPPSPPLFIGQQLRCPATDASGNQFVITASLQRSNGWITWQVDDWGVFSIVR